MLDWVTLMLAFLAVLLQIVVIRSKSGTIVERSTERPASSIPYASDHQLILDISHSIRQDTDSHWSDALCWIAENFDSVDQPTISAAFTGGPRPSSFFRDRRVLPLPSRFGYYVGYRVAERGAKEKLLSELDELGDEKARSPLLLPPMREFAGRGRQRNRRFHSHLDQQLGSSRQLCDVPIGGSRNRQGGYQYHQPGFHLGRGWRGDGARNLDFPCYGDRHGHQRVQLAAAGFCRFGVQQRNIDASSAEISLAGRAGRK